MSVDTKKKNWRAALKTWDEYGPAIEVLVKDHDFCSQATGIATPYGIYDVMANRGSVFVGTSHDTPEFATDCLAQWYAKEGQKRYPNATELLILADCGGGNGPRCRAHDYASWKRISAKLVEFF